MPKSKPSSKESMIPQETSSGQSPEPTQLPEGSEDIEKFRKTQDAHKLVAWIRSEHQKAASARTTKVMQWRQNLFMFYGLHWAERVRTDANGLKDTFLVPAKAKNRDRRTINRTRSLVRTELSRFLSSVPEAIAVPSTAEDEDIRAAYAAEQAWVSISERRKLRKHYTNAAWWMINTGNGFIKTWWDNTCVYDPEVPQDRGDIKFASVSPFNLFVPDLREQEIEDQPFIITAYKKPVQWVYYYFRDALRGVTLTPSTTIANGILEEGYLNLNAGTNAPDSVIVYEAWVKPGGTELLPNGGLVIIVEDTLVGIYREGLPYKHGEYPFTKFEHIPTSTFYADSPLVDTNGLQKEFNEWRSRLGDYVKKMSAPQIMAQKGAVAASKWTNETGLVIEVRPGFPMPQPISPVPIPQYVMDQGNLILTDWEDITGQHEVSRGQTPPGVTAGTAISFLYERDDQYLTPEYQSIEDGYEKIARQAISLFVQYVDVQRKIKVIGADNAFDTLMLSGTDLRNGTDIRIERGSSIGQSQAAKEAKIMDMWAIGLIQDPNQALHLLEMGGAQKVLDTLRVAERQAQRENTKLKSLDPMELQKINDEWEEQVALLFQQYGMVPPTEGGPDQLQDTGPMEGPPIDTERPPVIPVNDFDMHDVHIEVHNRFRMGQEYETLHPLVQEEFARHVALHERERQRALMMRFLEMIPSDGSEDGPGATDPASMEVPIEGPVPGADSGASPGTGGTDATMSTADEPTLF